MLKNVILEIRKYLQLNDNEILYIKICRYQLGLRMKYIASIYLLDKKLRLKNQQLKYFAQEIRTITANYNPKKIEKENNSSKNKINEINKEAYSRENQQN